MNSRINHLTTILFAGLLGWSSTAVFVGCGSGDSKQVSAKGSKKGSRPPALVEVAAVELRKVAPKIIVVGSIVPKRTSNVASGAEGIVDQFDVEEGQLVKKGETLSVLRMVTTDLDIKEAKSLLREREHQKAELENGSRPEEITEAQAKMLAAKAIMESTAATLARTQTLFARNATNQDELDAAQERAEAARQAHLAAEANFQLVKLGPRSEQIEQARARYQAQREHVAFLEAEKEKRITKAPFTGYVVQEHTYVGQWLSKGDPVVTLVLVDEVDAVVNVDQRDLKHVRLGNVADVKIVASEKNDWQGQIVSLVPRSEWKSGSRSFPIKVRLSNEFEDANGQRLPVLKEGMMAEVTFAGEPYDALLVPKDSLVRTSRGLIINIFAPNPENATSGTVRQIPVETGLSEVSRDGISQIEIKGAGLVVGMQVVTAGTERLVPFQPVQLSRERQPQERH